MLNFLSLGGYLGLLFSVFILFRRNRDRLIITGKFQNYNKWITTASLLAALAALLHAAPIYLPVIGMALSPLSSIPMIIGVLLFADGALAMFLAATALLFFINVEEALIFLLATGPLGLASALTVIPNIPLWQRLTFPTVLLTCGILLLAFLVGVPGIQGIIGSFHGLGLVLIVIFSLFYSSLFRAVARLCHGRLLAYFFARDNEAEVVDLDAELFQKK